MNTLPPAAAIHGAKSNHREARYFRKTISPSRIRRTHPPLWRYHRRTVRHGSLMPNESKDIGGGRDNRILGTFSPFQLDRMTEHRSEQRTCVQIASLPSGQ